MITINFDFLIRVRQPEFAKSLDSGTREDLNLRSGFQFNEPPPIKGADKPADIEPALTQEETDQDLDRDLDRTFEDLQRFARVIDERCSDITVTYNTDDRGNDQVVEAAEKVFGEASGEITYDMFVGLVQAVHRIDNYLSQRSAENLGTLDGD